MLHTDDLVRGDNAFFAATGVTGGDLLRGVRYRGGGAYTQSIVMRSKSGTIRVIDSFHRLEKLRRYSVVDFDGSPLVVGLTPGHEFDDVDGSRARSGHRAQRVVEVGRPEAERLLGLPTSRARTDARTGSASR